MTSAGLEGVFVGELREKVGPVDVEVLGAGIVRFGVPGSPAEVCSAVGRLRGAERVAAEVAIDRDVGSALDEALPAAVALCAAGEEAWNVARAVRRAWGGGGEPRTYRVTGRRRGLQAFKSMDLYGRVGSGVHAATGWKPDLHEYDAEVWIDTVPRADVAAARKAEAEAAHDAAAAEAKARGEPEDEVKRAARAGAREVRASHAALRNVMVLSVELFGEAAVRQRNRIERPGFQPITSLAPHLAYLVVRCADVRDGLVVLDPMCGVGTLPIEAAAEWPGCRPVGVDIDGGCVDQARANAGTLDGGGAQLRFYVGDSLLLHEVGAAPAGTVDRVVVDPPFGKRHGSIREARAMCAPLLRQVAIALKPGGLAAVLIDSRKGIDAAVEGSEAAFLERVREYAADIGGISGRIFVFRRLPGPPPPPLGRPALVSKPETKREEPAAKRARRGQ